MTAEFLSVFCLLTGGTIVARLLGFRGWISPAIGFVIGICLSIIIGLVQIVIPVLPTSPIANLIFTAILPAILAVGLRSLSSLKVSPIYILFTILVVAALVILFTVMEFTGWSVDSFSYIETSRLFANNQFNQASLSLIMKRMLGAPLMHAPASLTGEYYLISITPLLSVACLLIFWKVLQKSLQVISIDKKYIAGTTIIGLLILLTNNRYLFNSFYINGHLLFSTLVLIIVGCGWFLNTKISNKNRQSLLLLQTIAIAGLVLTRPEGSLVAGLILLPTLASEKISSTQKAIPLGILGLTTMLWQGYIATQFIATETDFTNSLIGAILLGVGATITSAFLLTKFARNFKFRKLMLATQAVLWSLLILSVLFNPALMLKSFYATFQNVILGAGLWGHSLVVLGYLALLVFIFSDRRKFNAILFPITTFIPSMFILAYVRDGAYRVGSGDSFNRMLLHILPILVLYVMLGVASIHRSSKQH